MVDGPAPSLGARVVPIVIDGSGSEYATSNSDWHSFDSFLDAEVPAAAASGDEIEQLRLQAAAAGKAAAFSAAASRDEIEQLRLQAAAAARSYREARDDAAVEAIYQAAMESNSTSGVESSEEPPNPFTSTPLTDSGLNARLDSRFAPASTSRSVVAVAASTSTGTVTSNVAPPADAQGGSTADGASADLRLILKSVLDIQKAIERMAARGI